ncbi:MAG: ATP-binding cassette domain-containing protein, partial [Magnetococcales bacterium]|nr:ATP-binding cassette domain-containing protein [Magnetococcales bacterium]
MPMSLLPVFGFAARLVGQPLPRDRLDAIGKVLSAKGGASGSALALVQKLWKVAQLDGIPQGLPSPRPLHCPFIVRHPQLGWLAVLSPIADNLWTAQNSDGQTLRLESLTGCECVALPLKDKKQEQTLTSYKLVWRAIWKRKTLYLESILATVLVNVLTLASSLYAMQVYDRVIPNRGLSTLFVLSAGMGVAILLELLIKHVRGTTLDKTATQIDMELSDWFYQRALYIRLEAHPPAVGTLASQIKGFELIRNVMSSTTLYVLADIPFAILFILVIAVIGGLTALVPLALLPVSLCSGMMFRSRINRLTLAGQVQNNQRAGLLVESIDSIESLKANSAEWNMQGRWNRLVGESSLNDLRIRHYTALSVHVTGLLQQFGYVALIAVGAYLVTENQMSMGALIACSIISSRALAPVAQLPSIIVHLGNAKAAADGLDRLIALPNELDEQAHALTPERLVGSLFMERARFTYGRTNQAAIEVGRLEIKPGERVGIIGAVGSGKSTLLKMASGLYRANAGRILLGGLEMALISPQVLRAHIAYLPQEIHLISGSLRDNLLMGL